MRTSRQMLLMSALMLTSCGGVQSALDPVGPQSRQIGTFWWLSLYLLTAVFGVVMIAVVAATLRRRRPNLSRAEIINGERRISRTILASVGVTVAILFALLIASSLVGRAIYRKPSESSNPLIIEVTGHQWWWAVRYVSHPPSQMVSTANEIHIPVGRPIVFRLSSTDVIHSFWVPNLHGKTDLIPGHPSETWLQADLPGIYRGQCAEFCGYQHAHMAFAIIAEPSDQFDRWYRAQLQSATPPANESQVRGQQVFLSRPCVMCHRIRGTDAGGNVGPDLTHVASRQTIAAGTLHTTREHLANWITNAQEIKPGNRMPPIPVEGDDLRALLDYLESLK